MSLPIFPPPPLSRAGCCISIQPFFFVIYENYATSTDTESEESEEQEEEEEEERQEGSHGTNDAVPVADGAVASDGAGDRAAHGDNGHVHDETPPLEANDLC